jgi:endonuclease/exonuclease/phosphatase family metal-dependent hydrolase
VEDIDDVLREMDRDFVGLQAVKEQVARLARRIKFDRIRDAHRRDGGRADASRL